ncbi:hypothetical protein J5J10_04475 [Ciceribacter sp. L1K23]|uniref:hypothetical protein n=1 Tax=Ciceribacter sp. L1K23 TaxID=2820276 RepID=UPI001B81F9A4|nr:hypothetical protein [Ciceribacter sp. L1K23]MBR0554929.1 hypothetical protein [Ciceribacter sp. L1K23]
MRLNGYLSVLLLAGALSGCNTAEGLTPPADVGDPGGYAPQSSATTMTSADAATYQAANAEQGYVSPPQNTLEAQAQALQAGAAQSPAQSQPLGAAQPSVAASQPLLPATSQPMPPQPAAQQAPSGQVAALPATSANTIRFLPIIGAPVQAVTPLSRQLGAEARAKGLTIKGASDPASRHILKGYFSAFSDGGKVNVVYVWDILDGNGTRLHRLQGQESVPGSGAEPWAAVPASLMQQIGSRTINDYVAWKAAQPG